MARSGKLWGWRIDDGDLRRSEDEDDDVGQSRASGEAWLSEDEAEVVAEL